MDLLPLIIGAQTFNTARVRVRDATGLDGLASWTRVEEEVRASGWALLVAPELWLVLEEHFAARRLLLDLRRARKLRNTAQVAALGLDPRIIGEGRDILSDRVTAATRAQDSVIRIEAELARRRDALHRYVLAYQARTSMVATMTPIEQARELLRSSLLAGRLELARELASVTSAGQAATVTGASFLDTFAGRVKGLFPHS